MKKNLKLFGTGDELILQDAEVESNSSWVEIIRIGNWLSSFKNFQIKKETLLDFVKNWAENVLRLSKNELQFNYGHRSDKEAAGWIKDLKIEGRRLMGFVEWTPEAVKKIQDKEFRFISAEIALLYEDQETNKVTPNVILGAALTNIPFVRGLKPVELSEDNSFKENDIFVLDNLKKDMETFKKMLSTLQGKEIVSLGEVELLKSVMLGLSDEEKEEVKEEVEKVEESAEEAEETAKKEEEVKGKEEEAKEKELSELRKKAKSGNDKKSVLLAEQVEASKELLALAHSKIDKLEAGVRETALDSAIETLCEEGKLLPKDKKKTIGMLMDLSPAKSAEWLAFLSAQPVRIELNVENGSAGERNLDDAAMVSKAKSIKKGGDERELSVILADLYAQAE